MTQGAQGGLGWLLFALMTVGLWGLYGIFLHTGQVGMADPVNGRYKAFLWVGIAYFLTAVLAPLALLVAQGSDWAFPAQGAIWSLLAGTVGAGGAFGVLLAFGKGGSPAVVLAIVFAGAPVVNAGRLGRAALAVRGRDAARRAGWLSGDLLAATWRREDISGVGS